MARNLDSRIEVTCPIYSKKIQKELRDMLDIQWSDNIKARVVDEMQKNQHKTLSFNQKKVRAQEAIYDYLKLINSKDAK